MENFEKVVEKLDDKFDLVYFDLEINDGSVFELREDTKYMYCGSTKFMRRGFIEGIKVDESKKAGEDWYFFGEVQERKPRELFTRIVAKHYNFPRKGSLSWRQRRGEFSDEEV